MQPSGKLKHLRDMKRFEKYVCLMLLPLMACSTSKLSSSAQNEDNVYVSKAKAKEYEPWVFQPEAESATREEPVNSEPEPIDRQRYDDLDRYDESDYMSYSSRIYRFNYSSPWRNYYDPWYDPFYYDSRFYYYDRFYWRTMPSWSFNIYFGNAWYDPWYYQSPYWRYRYWDIYSYYRTSPYPYWGGGYWGGGWGGVYPNYPVNPRYNRPRPSRNGENYSPSPNAIYRNGGQGNGSRADRYNGGTNANPGQGGRPSRANDYQSPKGNNNKNSGQSRPSRAERYSPPPSRNDNSSSGSSSRGNDSNESKPRPSRSGGR